MSEKTDKEIAAEILIAALNNSLLATVKTNEGMDGVAKKISDAYLVILKAIRSQSS